MRALAAALVVCALCVLPVAGVAAADDASPIAGAATADDGYHEGEDRCVPETHFEDPALPDEAFEITGTVEIVDSNDEFVATYEFAPGASVESYQVDVGSAGVLFDVVDTNMTEIDAGSRYEATGNASITLAVNTSDTSTTHFWESHDYAAFETRVLDPFTLTIDTDEGTIDDERGFVYTTFEPPRSYQGTELYDSEMVVFGTPDRVETYDTPDGSMTLVSDLEESPDGLNYSRVRTHLEADLNLTTDERHRAIYLFPFGNVSSTAGGCNARAKGDHRAIVHEYVHLRQHSALQENDGLQWMVEGGARYVDVSVAHDEMFDGTYSEPHYFMERSFYPTMNLSDPDTWPTLAEYSKGGRAHLWLAYLGIDIQSLYRAAYDPGFDAEAFEDYLAVNARKDPSRFVSEYRNESLMPRYAYGDRFLNDRPDLLVRNNTRHQQQVDLQGVSTVYYDVESPAEELPEADLSATANDSTMTIDLDAVGTGVDVYVKLHGIPDHEALDSPNVRYYDVFLGGEPVDYYFGKPDSEDPAFGQFDTFLAVPGVDLDEPRQLRFVANETTARAVTNPEYADDAVDFRIDGVDAPEAVEATAPFPVEATITNVGDGTETQTVTVSAADQQQADATVSLAPGETTTVTVENVSVDEAGTHDLSIDSNNHTRTAEIDVSERTSFFAVDALDAPDNASPGEPITVSATVTNEGTLEETQEIGLAVDGERIAATDRTLHNDETTVTFEDVTLDEQGLYEVAVVSDDDAATALTAVGEGFLVAQPEAPATVDANETFTVTATVANTLQQEELQEVTVSVDGATRDTTFLSIEPGERWETSFDLEIAEEGSHEVTVASHDDSGTTTVGVGEVAPFYDVDAPQVPETGTAGEPFAVSATVTNQGDAPGTQTVALVANDTTVATTTRTLDPGESSTVAFSRVTLDRPGTRELLVESDNDTATATIDLDATVETYADDDGTVTTEGLRTAVDHWRSGAIETELVLAVLDAWRAASR